MKKDRIFPYNRLAELRKAAGYSNRPKLLERLEKNNIYLSSRMYDSYETGEANIPLEFAYKLSRFYGVSVDYLMGFTDYEKPENAYIQRITGLSDKSIEVLREMNASGYAAQRSIILINHVLELEFDKVEAIRKGRQEGRTEEAFRDTLFSMIYEAISITDGTASRSFGSDNEDDYSEYIEFCSAADDNARVVPSKELWIAASQRRLNRWLEKEIDKAESVRNREREIISGAIESAQKAAEHPEQIIEHYRKVGERLKAYRGEKTVDEVARDLNISSSLIERSEAGRISILTDDMKMQLANYYGVTVEFLFS